MTTPTPTHTPRKTLYETLCDKYGSSAATTYTWQREAHHTPAIMRKNQGVNQMNTPTLEELTTLAQATNGKNRARTLSPRDVTAFHTLLTEHWDNPEVDRIRVYSGQGFVANSYQYRANISALEAARDSEGKWKWYGLNLDAKRTHGNGALRTINGRAV